MDSKPHSQPDRYIVREVKPGLFAIWDREKACYWEAQRDRHDVEALALAYNADQRNEYPSVPYGK